MELVERVALITGANTGVGRVIARRFCREGAHVWVNYLRDQGELESLREDLAGAASRVRGVQADLRVHEERVRMFESVLEGHGKLDILVNNAAVMHKGFLLALSEADWLDSIHTNLSAVYHACRLALPSMLRRKEGRILNIGSILAKSSILQQSAYCTSKAALEGITRGIAAGSSGCGVLINTLAPSITSTGIYADRWGDGSPGGDRPRARQVVDPEEIAEAALYLCSPRNTLISGQTLYLDGGWMLRLSSSGLESAPPELPDSRA